MNTNQEANSKPKNRLTRRDFLKLLKISGLGVLVSAAGYSIFTQQVAGSWDVSQVKLVLPRLPKKLSGIRVAQLSDFHMGGWMNRQRLNQVIQVVKGLAPDIVVMTGDFVLSSSMGSTQAQGMDEMEAELKALSKFCQTIGVMGNHDHWDGLLKVKRMLRRARVQALINDVQPVSVGGESLYFAGIDDHLAGQPNFEELLAKLPQQGCAILLSHEPDFADISSETGRFDLQISGHSHGGQVNLPFVGPPILPTMGRKYPSGLYRVKDMVQYTNRGVGMTPPSIRINCPPEITLFTLESA